MVGVEGVLAGHRTGDAGARLTELAGQAQRAVESLPRPYARSNVVRFQGLAYSLSAPENFESTPAVSS
jgi:hypothetical protein